MRIAITSGFYNPLRFPHIECINLCKDLADVLIVIVNNDKQVLLKRNVPFMDETNRLGIISNLKAVDYTFLSIDEDSTVCKSIEMIHSQVLSNEIHTATGYYNKVCREINKPNEQVIFEFIFGKGGDRLASEIPEMEVCRRLGVRIVDGLGEKNGSSSDILSEYIRNVTKVSMN